MQRFCFPLVELSALRDLGPIRHFPRIGTPGRPQSSRHILRAGPKLLARLCSASPSTQLSALSSKHS